LQPWSCGISSSAPSRHPMIGILQLVVVISFEVVLGGLSDRTVATGGEVSTLLALGADLIMAERECCHFLTFPLTAEAKIGSLTIRMTGMDGTKEVLKSILM